MGLRLAGLGLLLLLPPLRADRAGEIARIHVEAIGGQQRIDTLTALRMTGGVEAGDATVRVTLLAARPARVRIESMLGTRRVIQGTDGLAPPWQWEPSAGVTPLAVTAAERLLADAEFDDPLVRWEERGYRLQFAGEVERAGRRFLRVLVARKVSENLFVLLDPQTYFIAWRVQTLTRGAAPVEWTTGYDDYRPVAGVLLPHRVTVFENGRRSQEARFTAIEPNPLLDERAFQPPAGNEAPPR